VAGTPAGIIGRLVFQSVSATRKLEGPRHQHRERVLELGAPAIERDRLGFGRRHLRAGARDIQLGHVARAEAPLRQALRVDEGLHRARTSSRSASIARTAR
jgi:hypothetical protein